jgi:hypothetical protein
MKNFISIFIFSFVWMGYSIPVQASSNILIDNIVVERDGEEVKRPIPIADFVEMVMKQVAILQDEIRLLGKIPVNEITVDLILSQGSSGAEVKDLQILLNTTKDAQVAVSGPGSPGLETNFFGPLTRDAVLRFQASKTSLEATGVVDENTQSAINSLFVR